MVRAGEMVKLVQTLNSKLTQQQGVAAGQTTSGGTEDEATQTFLRSSLVQLGLPAPAITSDMVADERKYLQGLANELGGLLTGKSGREEEGLMGGRNGKGLVGMDEVWGLWNRARGVCEWHSVVCAISTRADLIDLGRPQRWSRRPTFKRSYPCSPRLPVRGWR